MSDDETRRLAAAHGGWVGETITRLLLERDDARLLANGRLLGTMLQQDRADRAEAELTAARAVIEAARGWGSFVAQMDSGKLMRAIEAYDKARGGREG